MKRDGVRQAAQVLRTHVTSLGARDHLAQVATVASLVYADRLNQPPIYPGDGPIGVATAREPRSAGRQRRSRVGGAVDLPLVGMTLTTSSEQVLNFG